MRWKHKAQKRRQGCDLGNDSYVVQSGSNNVAVAQQLPSAELLLLGMPSAAEASGLVSAIASGAWGGADGNSILLEQNGGDNHAQLSQIGSGHQIALRQEGNASITITQSGTSKSIAIQQPFGSQGIQITQY